MMPHNIMILYGKGVGVEKMKKVTKDLQKLVKNRKTAPVVSDHKNFKAYKKPRQKGTSAESYYSGSLMDN